MPSPKIRSRSSKTPEPAQSSPSADRNRDNTASLGDAPNPATLPDVKLRAEAATTPEERPDSDIIPLDIDGEDEHPATSWPWFLDRTAVLSGDAIEEQLLRSIWRLRTNNFSRFLAIGRITNPKYIGRKLKGIIDSATVIERLYRELDQYRHTILRNMILTYGTEGHWALKTKRHDSLAWSDHFLDGQILDQMADLDEVSYHCERQIKELRALSNDVLSGIVKGHATGFDRSAWEDEFLSCVTSIEASKQKLRKMLSERSRSVAKACRPGTTGADESGSRDFAIAKNIEKATTPVPLRKGILH